MNMILPSVESLVEKYRDNMIFGPYCRALAVRLRFTVICPVFWLGNQKSLISSVRVHVHQFDTVVFTAMFSWSIKCDSLKWSVPEIKVKKNIQVYILKYILVLTGKIIAFSSLAYNPVVLTSCVCREKKE